jgi:hypothetical protein
MGELPEEIKSALHEWMADTISDISEDRYCAAWMAGVEFDLFKQINGQPSGRYDSGYEQAIDRLRQVSELLDEWPIWDDDGTMTAIGESASQTWPIRSISRTMFSEICESRVIVR